MLKAVIAMLAVLGFVAAPPVSAESSAPAPAPASTPASAPAGTQGAARGIPSESVWSADVHTALKGARAFVRHRAADATPGERLALNLDIDDTAIATTYGGGAVSEVLRLTQLAQRHDVAVLFNSARPTTGRNRTLAQLRAAGYQVDGLCLRIGREVIPSGKQRCRAQYADQGYTLIANLGNNPTDFAGSGYERAYRLPNYDGLLP